MIWCIADPMTNTAWMYTIEYLPNCSGIYIMILQMNFIIL